MTDALNVLMRWMHITSVVILVGGMLYARLGAQGFWVMAALCALAFPLTWKLRQPCSAKIAD